MFEHYTSQDKISSLQQYLDKYYAPNEVRTMLENLIKQLLDDQVGLIDVQQLEYDTYSEITYVLSNGTSKTITVHKGDQGPKGDKGDKGITDSEYNAVITATNNANKAADNANNAATSANTAATEATEQIAKKIVDCETATIQCQTATDEAENIDAELDIDTNTITITNRNSESKSVVIPNSVDACFSFNETSSTGIQAQDTTALGDHAHSVGSYTRANGAYSHAEGHLTLAEGYCSHAEGGESNAYGMYSHAEGKSSANANYAHSEGTSTVKGDYSHAEGNSSTKGAYSHAENEGNANGAYSHAEGKGYANGQYSHAEGYMSSTLNANEHAEGTYNKSTKGITIHSVGIGTSSTRKNAEETTIDGKKYLLGIGGYDGTNVTDSSVNDIATYLSSLEARIAAIEGA